MNIKPENDPTVSPQDSRPAAERKQRARRGIVTFLIIFAVGAFSLYALIVLYAALTSN